MVTAPRAGGCGELGWGRAQPPPGVFWFCRAGATVKSQKSFTKECWKLPWCRAGLMGEASGCRGQAETGVSLYWCDCLFFLRDKGQFIFDECIAGAEPGTKDNSSTELSSDKIPACQGNPAPQESPFLSRYCSWNVVHQTWGRNPLTVRGGWCMLTLWANRSCLHMARPGLIVFVLGFCTVPQYFHMYIKTSFMYLANKSMFLFVFF